MDWHLKLASKDSTLDELIFRLRLILYLLMVKGRGILALSLSMVHVTQKK